MSPLNLFTATIKLIQPLLMCLRLSVVEQRDKWQQLSCKCAMSS